MNLLPHRWTLRDLFTSHDRGEPAHVHVDRERMTARLWLSPLRVAFSLGFSRHELRRIERVASENEQKCLKAWNDYSEPRVGERITAVSISDDSLTIDLLDGRSLTVPLAWYPRLLHATEAHRSYFRIIGGGFIIHWPDVDEHLSSQGLLAGAPAWGAHAARGAG